LRFPAVRANRKIHHLTVPVEVPVSRPNALMPQATGFERFLYSFVGQDANGLPLSVLSVIARHDVDPWEEAAKLSQLPERAAVSQLVSMLGAPPQGPPDSEQQTRTAARLIALLPPRCVAPLSVRNALAEIVPRKYSAMIYYSIATFVIYIAVTVLGS
jgi:hypothetical protein